MTPSSSYRLFFYYKVLLPYWPLQYHKTTNIEYDNGLRHRKVFCSRFLIQKCRDDARTLQMGKYKVKILYLVVKKPENECWNECL